MSDPANELICPSCGSRNVEAGVEEKQLVLPFAPVASYEATVNHCLDCDLSGDFQKKNDAMLLRLIEESKKKSVSVMVNRLGEQGLSMAYMERALDLPARTMMRWKTGDLSAGAMALLRVVTTYPWTLEVADAKFDALFATKRLAHESLGAMNRLANMFQVKTIVDVSPDSATGGVMVTAFLQPTGRTSEFPLIESATTAVAATAVRLTAIGEMG